MKQKDDGMSAAWSEAAADLDIRVEAPYMVADSNGLTRSCVAFVADFASPRGLLVTSLTTSSDDVARCLERSGAMCSVALARDTFGRYERHEWIDLLESLRWYGEWDPPSWYTATSPWHRVPEALEAIGGELTRIFGHPVRVETSPVYQKLYLVSAADVLAFLARVPAGGVTPASFAQWVADVAEEWDRVHPRLNSRPSNER